MSEAAIIMNSKGIRAMERPSDPCSGHKSLLANIGAMERTSEQGRNHYTDKKEKKIFHTYKEIKMGAVAKSYIRKGFLIYERMRKYLVMYEEAVCHI
jgi:hypothetical protein